MTTNVDRVKTLLKGIETGDPDAVLVISPDTYIQHNPQTHTGRDGLAALFARLATTSPRVNIVRAFADGDFVFGHTEYDFATRRVGFEVFRFEDGLAVEHWDNIQPRRGPNRSGHSMVDGPTEATDLHRTEAHRERVRDFVHTVLIGGAHGSLEAWVDPQHYTEHHPTGADGIDALRARLQGDPTEAHPVVYSVLHRVLACGNFALAVIEGSRGGASTAFYALFRLQDDRIVEHWDTVEAVAPPDQWKHHHGKF